MPRASWLTDRNISNCCFVLLVFYRKQERIIGSRKRKKHSEKRPRQLPKRDKSK